MSDVFFGEKHQQLMDDYRDSCSVIAWNMAKLLGSEGLSTKILVLRGEKIDHVGNRDTLIPLPYEGRITWGAHVVCLADQTVHDPMLDRPLKLDDYLRAAFNQAVDVASD